MNQDVTLQLSGTLAMIGKVAGWVWQRGWAEWGAGNLSLDISDMSASLGLFGLEATDQTCTSPLHNLTLLMSLAGARMTHLAEKPENCLCLVKASQNSVAATYPLTVQRSVAQPTTELQAHLAIHDVLHKVRPAHRAVLHVHPAEAIAFSQMQFIRCEKTVNQILFSLLPELSLYLPTGIGLVPSFPAGSKALAEATAEVMKSKSVTIWQKHGMTATGATIEEAFDAIDLVVKAIRVYFLIRPDEAR